MIRKIKSFLAYRISFIVLLLTTLPLFIYSIYFYITEYEQKKGEILKTNNFIGSQIKKNIEKDLILKNQILSLVFDEIELRKENLDNVFVNIAKQFNLYNLFYAVYKKDNLIIKNAAKQQVIGNDVSAVKDILNSKTALFKNQKIMCLDCLYFSKTIYKNQKPMGVVALSILQKDFFDFSDVKLPSGLEISIVDSKNRIIISTNKNLKYLDLFDKANKMITKDSINGNAYTLIIAVNKRDVQLMYLKNYFFKHGIVLTIIILFLVAVSILLVKLLANPLNALLNTMHSIKTGDMKARYQKQKMGFEINYLGEIFNETMDSLIYHQEEIEKERIDKLKYLQELTIAKEIQLSLLPDKDLSIKNVELAFGNIYAKEVGGDFYDFIEKDGKVFFIIADIATKGILACLYALTLRSIIRSFATNFSSLDQLIINTNKLFMKDAVKNSMFATAFFGIYNIDSKELQYCNCGHMPAILKKTNGKLNFLTTQGKALGIEEFNQVQVNKVTLEKEDFLFLYTDGIIDAIDINNKFYGEKNLHEFIKKAQNLPAKEVVKSLFDSLNVYSKDTSQYDDTTVVVFKII